MSNDARSVANYIVQRSVERDKPLTPLQINKIVYFCHGWMLGIHSVPLYWQFVEAWRLGPVVPDVYHSLKHYGGELIWEPVHAPPEEPQFSPIELAVLDRIYSHYAQFDGVQLSTMTHAHGTPWDITWKKFGQNHVISNKLIENHFAARVKRPSDAKQ